MTAPVPSPHPRTSSDVGEFAGRVVVVTGGSRGLGREIVRAFAARGADTVIASRKVEACRELAAEVEADHGIRALPVGCNVSSWTDCDRLVDAAYDEFGTVDVLINNAGLSPHYDSLPAVTRDLFDKVVAINLSGPFRLMATVGTRMAASGGGSIINIGSIQAIRPNPSALPYAAAKAGLHTLTEGFAQALGPTVRVNTIQPGAFLTDVAPRWRAGLRQEIEETVALNRCAHPDEVVGAALFFAGSASSYATGALLRLDGGWK